MARSQSRLYETVGVALLVMLLVMATVPALAALNPKLSEWGKGPAQWIMTSEEQRAWRSVKTDTDAIQFIDLFWARRDPTPGTAVNEFRNEFESRVAISDLKFAEKRKRGAMTDRGRVYIVLGPATNMNNEMRHTTAEGGVTDRSRDPSGGRQMGSRFSWIWEHADAEKFGMGRIEVVFIEDPVLRRVQRDPARTDFGMANPAAIRKAIVNPGLTGVPAWAPTGGLEPVITTITSQTPAPASANSPPPPVLIADTPGPEETETEDEGPAIASDEPGAARLIIQRKGSIDPRSPTDPFAGVESETTFSSGDDVAWAVQYCASKAEVPKLKFILLIAGPLDGKSTDRVTREKDAEAVRITAQPGCYAVQGKQSLRTLPPGKYKLGVLLDDPVTGDSYDVRKDFRIE